MGDSRKTLRTRRGAGRTRTMDAKEQRIDSRDRWFESVPYGNDTKSVASWFDRSFVRGLKEDAAPSHWSTARDPDAGVFPITLLCLSYLTAAAGLVLGIPNADTIQVVDFISDWFGRFPERSGAAYCEHAAALYPLFRHGLAHQRHPGLLDTGDGRSLGWALGRKTDRRQHLVLAHAGMAERATGRRISYILAVQADLLFDDALRVLGAVENAAAADEALARRISKGAWKAKTRNLCGRAEKVLMPRIRTALDALDAAVPPVA